MSKKDMPDELKLAWVYLAAMIALVEELCPGDKVAQIVMSRKLRSKRGRKKLVTWMRDPANRAKVAARHRQAAGMLGLSGETRH